MDNQQLLKINRYIYKNVRLSSSILCTHDFTTDSSTLNFILEKVCIPEIVNRTVPAIDYYKNTYDRYIKKSELGSDVSPGPDLTSSDINVARKLVKKYILDKKYGIYTDKDMAIQYFFQKFVNNELTLYATWKDLISVSKNDQK